MRLLRNDTDQTVEFDYNREEPEEDTVRKLTERIEAERRLEGDEQFQEAIPTSTTISKRGYDPEKTRGK